MLIVSILFSQSMIQKLFCFAAGQEIQEEKEIQGSFCWAWCATPNS